MSDIEGLEKVDVWLKEWFPETTFSKQDIREICRGPMKGILQDFLVPRFRTEDHTYVIRSNLYAQGTRSALPTPPGLDMEEEKLRRELEDLDLEKDAALNGLLEKSEKLRELQDADFTSDSLGFKRRHCKNLKNMIYYSNALLDDLKPLLVTDEAVYMEKEKHYESFKTIQDEAISLFQSIFFDGVNTDSEELVEKNNKIHRLIEQVVRGGLSTKEIIRWHKNELEQAKNIVRETQRLFGKADSSPLEELAKEAEGLKRFLTNQHLELYNKNVELATKLEKVKEVKQRAQMDVIEEHFGTFAPVDFLKFVRKEELKSKLKKCQELSQEIVTLGPRESLESIMPTCTHRNSLNRTDHNLPIPSANVTQEKLEDITSGVLRNWPATKSKLIEVAKKGRELIPDQFITALKADGKMPVDAVDNPQSNCYLHSMINIISESEGISSCSGFEPADSFNEPSLLALNPNSENWCLGSFVRQYNGNQRSKDDLQNLTDLWLQLEQTSAKTGSANLEILEHLIQDATANLNKFSDSPK